MNQRILHVLKYNRRAVVGPCPPAKQLQSPDVLTNERGPRVGLLRADLDSAESQPTRMTAKEPISGQRAEHGIFRIRLLLLGNTRQVLYHLAHGGEAERNILQRHVLHRVARQSADAAAYRISAKSLHI